MNPLSTIKQQRFLIQSLRKEYPNSNNKKRDWERIKILENCINEFESMLQYSYYTDTIEKLLYAYMYEYFLKANAQDVKGVPMDMLNFKMQFMLNCNKAQMKEQVLSTLKSLELNKILSKLDPLAFDRDKEFNEKFKNMISDKEYSKLLDAYVSKLKTSIKWSKK